MGLPSIVFGFSNPYEYPFQNKKIVNNIDIHSEEIGCDFIKKKKKARNLNNDKGLASLMEFPGSPDGKESACNAGDQGLIPELGRFSKKGMVNPLQYS